MIALFNPWIWAILATLLAGAELFLPGVFLIWIAAAAGMTAVLVGITGIAWQVQLVCFAALSVVSVMMGRLVLGEDASEPADPVLNRPAKRLVGTTAFVSEALRRGRGRVKVADTVWNAEGPDLPVGARVRILAVAGNTLQVEPD